MGKVLTEIDDELAEWISRQPMFFVATAPAALDGHINCSPKGGDCLRVISPTQVAYLDYTGSGVETIAHVRENGRITVMFCAFDSKPLILRLYGQGEVVAIGDPDFDRLAAQFPVNAGARAVIKVNVERVSTACGFAVPLMDFRENRNTVDKWAESKGPDGLDEYRKLKNCKSIDGIPAL